MPVNNALNGMGWEFYDPATQAAWLKHARHTTIGGRPINIYDTRAAKNWYNRTIAGQPVRDTSGGFASAANELNARPTGFGAAANQLGGATGRTGSSVASWRKAKAAENKNTSTAGASGSGGGIGGGVSNDSLMEEFTNTPNPLPAFGWPSKSRVSGIVNSIVAEATKNQRWANQDIDQGRRQDLATITGGSQAFGRGTGHLKTGAQNLSDKLRAQNIAHEAISDAKTQRIRSEAEQASQQGSVPLEYAIQDAGNNASYELANSGIQTTNMANQSILDLANQANMLAANQGMQQTNAAARKAIAENNRAMAEIKSRTPLTRLEVEKQLQDMHIARRIAEAQYAQAGFGMQNETRKVIGDTMVGVEDARAKLVAAKAKLSAAKQKDMQIVHDVLFGTPTNSEVIAGYNPEYKLDEATGQVVQVGVKPIILNQAGVAGGPTSAAEAIQRLASLGYVGAKWSNLARSAMNSLGYR
jgi:hypothetical protein